MARYRDELINEPPARAPVEIGGYGMRRKRRVSSSGESSTPAGSSAESEARLGAKPRGRPRKKPMMDSSPEPRSVVPVRQSGKEEKVNAPDGAFEEDFSSVGGLEEQLKVLEESVVFPLVYPWMFGSLGAAGRAAAPRGILLTGASGCGKTLCVRALVGSLHKAGVKVSLYLRKGADALSKYVGEGEKKLKAVFEEAKNNQPAIIFFDEIDGLAPIRSSDSASVHHTSLVTTLLALMDGIENRGEQVVVIGATNRPEALDPALRRPGRFDKELKFEPPRTPDQRKAVLLACLRKWPDKDKPKDKVIDWIAKHTVNFTGADLNALVNGAVMTAVRRTFGGFYGAGTGVGAVGKQQKQQLRGVKVKSEDFVLAMKAINPNKALDLGGDASSQIHLPVSPVLSALFSAEIAAFVRCISSAIGISGGAEVPDYFQHNAIYVQVPEQHQQFPAVFRYAVLPSVIGNFSGSMNTLGISAFTEELGTSATAAAGLVQSALRLSPALVVVDDSVFDDAVVDATVQRAVADTMRSVLLPGRRVFGVFLGRANRKIPGMPYVNFTPKLETGSIRRRIEEVLLEHAEIATRQVRAQFRPREAKSAKPHDALARLDQEATHWHEQFAAKLTDVLEKLGNFPSFLKVLGALPDRGSAYYAKVANPLSIECMTRKNDRRQYLALAEFVADVDTLSENAVKLGAGAVGREFRETAHGLLRGVDKQLITRLDDARERLARRLQDEDEEDAEASEPEEEAEISSRLRQVIKEKALEVEINYDDWDKVANEVVSAVRFIQAKAKDLV